MIARAHIRRASAHTTEPECMRDYAELTAEDVARLDAAGPLTPGLEELLRKTREALDDPHPRALREMEKSGPVPKAKPDQKTSSVHDRTLKELLAEGRR